jgi:2-dehydro-3-deoxygalactonokinase
MSAPSFIAVDWGTSSFRLWVLAADGTILGESRGPDGMLSAAKIGFSIVLQRHLKTAQAPSNLPILICGMAGARGGWMEAGYVETPAALTDLPLRAVEVSFSGRDTRILPGLCQRTESRPDVMRGEEMQLFGAAASIAGRAHVVMPGTHSKWVVMDEGSVASFSTYMTGELYDIITRHSILTPPEGTIAEGPESAAFINAVRDSFEEPGRITSQLFAARSGQILNRLKPEAALAHISGTLIGAEISGGTAGSHGTSVVLVASGRMAALYEKAFETVGLAYQTIDADTAVRRGLQSAAAHIWQHL